MGIIPDGSPYLHVQERMAKLPDPAYRAVKRSGEDGAAVLPPKINKAAAVKIGSSLIKLMRDHALVLASAGTDAMTRLAEQQSEEAHVERDKNESNFMTAGSGLLVLIDADVKSRKACEQEPTHDEIIDRLKQYCGFLKGRLIQLNAVQNWQPPPTCLAPTQTGSQPKHQKIV
jgi:hypothetical protein